MRKLSSAAVQEKQEKLVQRVMKNRQSAQASRERRRRYVSDLEMNRAQLFLQTQALQQRVSQLEADKSQLLDQIGLLRQEFLQLKNRQLAIENKETGNVVVNVTEPATPGSPRSSLPSASEPLCGVAKATCILPPLSCQTTRPSTTLRPHSVSKASASPRNCSFWNCSPRSSIRQTHRRHRRSRRMTFGSFGSF